MRDALARPRSIAARIVLTASSKAGTDRLADQEMTDVEFDDLGQRGDRLRAGIVQSVAGMDFQPALLRQPGAFADARPFRLRRRIVVPSISASHQAPTWISITGARTRAAASICRGSATMNSETRMPASVRPRDDRRQRIVLARDVEAAFGGALAPALRHQARGMRLRLAARCRPSLPSPPFRNSAAWRFSAFSRAMSSSRIWRRSSRRWAVMPSAPASIAIFAARTGSGMHAAARVADGRDVVDVHAEAQVRRLRQVTDPLEYKSWAGPYAFTRSAVATTFLARNCAMIEVRCLRS